ncbi:MAG: hypothetical protein E7Z69_05605 [Thermoplasmata archaeon]|nr:hypothetical protein [Thermoplasmata archaeon]
MIDEEGSRIIHSFDIALTCSDDSNRLFIKNDKKSRAYIWNLRRSEMDLDAKIAELKNEIGGEYHSAIADEYLKLKNRNTNGDKRSFVLYAEAVCNLHNQVFQSSDDEYDDDDDYRCPADGNANIANMNCVR